MLEELKKLDSFWTIESRLVNYLGILSRDLGRELSLNDFLVKLAPELQDPRIAPIIPDATHFRKLITYSHKVTEVEFSRRHQQLFLKWETPPLKIPELLITDEEIKEINAHFEEPPGSFRVNLEFYDEFNHGIFVVPPKGDIPGIDFVKSRLAVILNPDCSLHNIIKNLVEAITKLTPKRKKSKDRIYLLVTLALIGSRFLNPTHILFDHLHLWETTAHRTNIFFDKLDIDIKLPDKFDEVLGAKKSMFDPSHYWFDWERGHSY